MKEAEMLDIVLRGLYEYRTEPKYYKPSVFIPGISNMDDKRLAEWLCNNGYAKSTNNNFLFLKITSNGVMYCEETSMSFPGHPIVAITYIETSNSPGASIHVGINGQVIYEQPDVILEEIKTLKISINEMKDINQAVIPLLGQCLDEIALKIEERKPVPKFVWDWLSRFNDVSTIYDKIEGIRKAIEI